MELATSTTSAAALRSEQALVAAARRGDDRAFEQLYAEYRDRVSAFILSKVRDHGRSEDIAQEVFMSALRQLRSSEQEIAFKPWIFAIAKNACIDEFRRNSRGREVPVETDDGFPTDARASLSLAPTPPAAIESKQRLEDLRGAFGGLSENQHKLLVMREFEGRSYDEIGDRLGMTRQMVESGLFRARRKLSEEYDELASGRRCEQVQTVIETGAIFKLKALGIKERRRLTSHLSHCQACRHQARLAGVDDRLLKPRSIAAKIAALLPFGGLWRWPWRGGGRGGRGGLNAARAHAASTHVAGSGAAGAAGAAGTAGSSITLGQAAAAAAALVIAGAGGGIAIANSGHGGHRPAPATHHLRTTNHAASAPGASVAPAARPAPGDGSSAQRARPGASNARSHRPRAAARATSARSTHGRGSHHSRSGSPTSTPTSGGKTSTAPTSPLGSATAPLNTATTGATGLLNTTINQTRPIVSKTKSTVTKITAPVLSSPPVKKVTSTVGSTVGKILPPSNTGSSGSTGATGSTGSGATTAPNPVSTVQKIISGL